MGAKSKPTEASTDLDSSSRRLRKHFSHCPKKCFADRRWHSISEPSHPLSMRQPKVLTPISRKALEHCDLILGQAAIAMADWFEQVRFLRVLSPVLAHGSGGRVWHLRTVLWV